MNNSDIRRPAVTTITLACLAALLSACGGGGEAGDGPARTPIAAKKVANPPSSLGADGWATVGADGGSYPVTGGEGADAKHVYVVKNRQQLVKALYGKVVDDPLAARPDNTRKIIYISGTVDLNVDDEGVPLTHEDYMRKCETSYASFAEFDAAYKAAYDPNLWIRQSLEADNRPPLLPFTDADGKLTLEGQRACFANEQARRVVLRVGSNTSILGLGSDARIMNGNLRLGDFSFGSGKDAAGRTLLAENIRAENIVIRNIAFEDSYDMFPGWDPKDSFSITASEFNTGSCRKVYDAVADTGPHKCPSRRGGRWNAEYDLISVLNATNVWIDRNTFSDGARPDKMDPPVPTWAAPFNVPEQKVQHHDGLVDVTMFGNRVTISYNQFRQHDKTHLIGGNDVAERFSDGNREVASYGPDKLAVTLHHNHYQDTVQRQPRGRFGKVHVYNNYYTGTLKPRSSSLPSPDYAWSVAWQIGTASKLYVENNMLEILPGAIGDALPTPSRLTMGDSVSSTTANRDRCVAAGYSAADCDTYFQDIGTLLNGTALADGSLLAAAQGRAGGSTVLVRSLNDYWKPGTSYAYTAQPTGAVKAEVLAKAGAGKL
ncbi:hypothetical protein [Caldimonas tepidiphila]|uniref:pectate lyase family protein n=1 Tax=Caldimonas tepidiphila TaxID=2315841 RepID=UPI000E5B834F|nr:hypothetical protein [Caldimonas tepidiphila]